jgi:hypothetical protein
MKREQTVCSETSVYKIQTSGNYPEESIKQEIFSFSKKCPGLLWGPTSPSIKWVPALILGDKTAGA